jgi:membrane protease YdiL (CAAX protease family)
MERDRGTPLRAALVAVAVGALGWFVTGLYGLALRDVGAADTESARILAGGVASALGAVTVTTLYLRESDRDRGFLDVSLPDLRGAGLAVGGLVAVFAALYGLDALYGALGVETASHGAAEGLAGAGPTVLAAAVASSVLLVGPSEEVVYRNLVQKPLYGQFSRPVAVVFASGVFAAVHWPAYAALGAPAESVAATLAVVFVLALVLGAVYAATENVVVPAVVHGVYNAVTFASVILGG